MSQVSALQWYHTSLWTLLLLCPIVFAALQFLPAAYGRHKKARHWLWGPGIPTRLAWMIMESPSSVGFVVIFFLGERALHLVPILLLVLWQTHYAQRTFIYPLRMQVPPGDTTPLMIPVLAISSNCLVSFLNASSLSWVGIARGYDTGWLQDPRFIVGVLLFAAGYHINRRADAMLAALRKPGESGYRIPRGWLFEWVTCPNYFGEILIWSGWAIATWSPGGLAFLLWTLANLLPRAFANQRWYRATFPDYPAQRKVVLPYLL